MELYQLRTFVIVAEEGSITRAAKRLFTTPPSISAHIRMLEDEWKVTLFRRTARGMEITKKGETLRCKAQATLLAAQDLSNHATELLECLMGSLTVGLSSSATFLRVPGIVKYFRDHRPGVELRFTSQASGGIIDDLRNQSLDAGFIFGPAMDEAIAAHWLTNTELAVVVPNCWRGEVIDGDWQTIAKLPWIASNHYCPFETITEKLFRHRNLRYQPIVQADSDRTKLELIGAGLGVALLERAEAEEATAGSGVFIWQTEPIRSDLFFVHLSSRTPDPLIRELQTTVMTAWDASATTSASSISSGARPSAP